MNISAERSVANGEPSSVSAAPAPIENSAVDGVYFQNGLLKANISWTVTNGEICCVICYSSLLRLRINLSPFSLINIFVERNIGEEQCNEVVLVYKHI